MIYSMTGMVEPGELIPHEHKLSARVPDHGGRLSVSKPASVHSGNMYTTASNQLFNTRPIV